MVNLCYNQEKGFYCTYGYTTKDFLCSSHEKKGFDSKTMKVEEKGIEIEIKSNFDFKNLSYLFAKIKLNGKYLLNFDVDMLHVVGFNHPTFFHVRPVVAEWETLFNKVATICNNSLLVNSDTIRDYFSELNKMIESRDIEIYDIVKGSIVNTLEGPLPVLYQTSRLIVTLIEVMDSTIYNFPYVNSLLLETCKHFLRRFKLEYNCLNLDEKKSNEVITRLFKIHEYMNQQNCSVDFVTSLL